MFASSLHARTRGWPVRSVRSLSALCSLHSRGPGRPSAKVETTPGQEAPRRAQHVSLLPSAWNRDGPVIPYRRMATARNADPNLRLAPAHWRSGQRGTRAPRWCAPVWARGGGGPQLRGAPPFATSLTRQQRPPGSTLDSYGLQLGPGGSTDYNKAAAPKLSRTRHHRAINKMLLAAEGNLEELLAIVEEHAGTFNEVNVSTALNRLSRCAEHRGRQMRREWRSPPASQQSRQGRPRLHRRLHKAVRVLEDCLVRDIHMLEPWALAISLHALAKLGMGGARACRAVDRRVMATGLEGFNAQQLTDIVWTCAKINECSPRLLDAIAEASVSIIHSFNPQDLCNTTWAFATLGHRSDLLFSAVAKTILVRCNISEFTPQALTNIVWAFSRNEHSSRKLYDAVAAAAVVSMDDFSSQGLANIVWAFGKSGHRAPELFNAVGEAAVEGIHLFSTQALANIVFAFAEANHKAPQLFDAVGKTVVDSARHRNPHSLTNIVWAFGKLDHRYPQLFDTVAKELVAGTAPFRPQAMVSTVWAFAAMKHSAPELFDRVAERIVGHTQQLTSQELTNLAWAYATMEHTSTPLFSALGDAAACKSSRFTMRGLANTVWAFASLRHCHPTMFSAVCQEVVGSSSGQDINSVDLSTLLLGFAKLAEPAPGLVDTLMDRWGQLNDAEISRQARTTMLYALALRGRLDRTTLRQLAAPLAEEQSKLTEQGKVQLFQCCLAVALKEGHEVAEVALDLLGPDLYASARSSWMNIVQQTTESNSQMKVHDALCRLGLPLCNSEQVTDDGLFSVDVMLQLEDGRRVAVEFDGPCHYSSTSPYRVLAATLLRRQLLQVESRAHALVVVPFFEWEQLRGDKAEEDRYLRDKLRQYLA